MIDIKLIRENPEMVRQNMRNKFQDNKVELVDKVLALDSENRTIKTEVEALRAERNKSSKLIGGLMAQGKKDEAEAMNWAAKSTSFPPVKTRSRKKSRR